MGTNCSNIWNGIKVIGLSYHVEITNYFCPPPPPLFLYLSFLLSLSSAFLGRGETLFPSKLMCPPPCSGLKVMHPSELQQQNAIAHEIYPTARGGGQISFLGQSKYRLRNDIAIVSQNDSCITAHFLKTKRSQTNVYSFH